MQNAKKSPKNSRLHCWHFHKKIEVLKSIEVGINENPNESWDLVLTAIVEKMEDVEKYAKHPAHLAAAALLGTHKENRACVDYQF
jgi:hypothetical protein